MSFEVKTSSSSSLTRSYEITIHLWQSRRRKPLGRRRRRKRRRRDKGSPRVLSFLSVPSLLPLSLERLFLLFFLLPLAAKEPPNTGVWSSTRSRGRQETRTDVRVTQTNEKKKRRQRARRQTERERGRRKGGREGDVRTPRQRGIGRGSQGRCTRFFSLSLDLSSTGRRRPEMNWLKAQ